MSREWVFLALFVCSTALCCWAQDAPVGVADSETALQIAESAGIKAYGREEIDYEQPLTIMRNRDTWEVYGTPCCPERNGRHTCQVGKCVGGVVHVSIRPSDGKVLLIERRVWPRVTFAWPDDATPQTVISESSFWDGNRLCGGGSTGSYSGQGMPFVVSGLCPSGPARHARLAIYASGCRSQKFDLDLTGSEVSERLRCDPLPNKTVRGFIPPDQIPRVPTG